MQNVTFCKNLCSERCEKTNPTLFLGLFTVLQKNTQYILVFDGFVILSCFASLILCTRSIVLALRLQKVSTVLIISVLILSVLFAASLVKCSKILGSISVAGCRALTVSLSLGRMCRCL